MTLPMRNEVPTELTWDLTLIYPDEQDLFNDFDETKKLADAICSTYPGKLSDPEMILNCLDELEQLNIHMDRMLNYVELASAVDYYDNHIQEFTNRIRSGASEIRSRLSFIDSEILQAPDAVLQQAVAHATGSKGYLEDLIRWKPHQLSPETERILALFGPVFETPYNVYNMSKLADMKFEPFTVDGKEYPLGYSLYEDDYEYNEDTAVRRAAHEAFYQKLRQYENTNAAIFNANATRDKLEATARGFDSVFDFLLFNQKVTREMYDRQIDLLTEYLAPHMRRYAKLLQKAHGLDRMTFADLKLPLDPEFAPTLTLEQAKDYCMRGLSILGDDYAAMVEEAFDHRWFDLAKNQGKSTGGFCAPVYRKNSFILLNWNNRMSDVLTMAHELGHAGHFKACSNAQSLFDTEPSTYLVESPSTMNELLMAHYLIDHSEDPRFRRWVTSCMIGNTYYHDMVTHLREAWFQREVYRIIDAGGSVNAETLNGLFRKNLEIFWGDAVELTEGCELTWMRQPHYYMGLYPYTYSAGLTLATQVCKRIEAEGQTAVEGWKRMLAAGGTEDPIGLAKIAGIDLTSPDALMDTIDYIGKMIDTL